MPEQRQYWQAMADRLGMGRRVGWSRVREDDSRIEIVCVYVPAWALVTLAAAVLAPFVVGPGGGLTFIEVPLLAGAAVMLALGGDFWRVRIGKRLAPSEVAFLPLAWRGGRRLNARGLLLAGQERLGQRWLRRWWPHLSPGIAAVFLVLESDRTVLLRQFPGEGWEQAEPWQAGQEPLLTTRHWATHLQRPLVLRRGAGLEVEVTYPYLDKQQDIAELDLEIKLAAQEVLEEEIDAGLDSAAPPVEDEPTGAVVEIDAEAADRELEAVIHPKDHPPAAPG